MINIGDKMVVTKKIASFLDEGDIITISDVAENGMISFAFGEGFMHKGIMNVAECEEHFEKFVEKRAEAPTITEEDIAEIMENSEFEIHTVFDKCTVVSCRLPNGFVITESSACVSPENYDEDMGAEICFDKIADKIWELEGYRLQQELYEMNNHEMNKLDCDKTDCDKCDYEDCDCYNCDGYDDCEEPYCEFCDDCECPCHPNH